MLNLRKRGNTIHGIYYSQVKAKCLKCRIEYKPEE